MKSLLKTIVFLTVVIFSLVLFSGCEKECKHTGGVASCTEPGVCTECGEIYFDPIGHSEKIDEAVPATCDKTGLTEGRHCRICETVFAEQEIVPMSEHSYDNDDDMICNSCGSSRVEVCLHTLFEIIPGKAATCTETGLTEGKKCNDCGNIFKGREIIPATGHSFDNALDENCNVCTHTRDISNAFIYDGEQVTITFYHSFGQTPREVLDKYIEEFNKIYPNIWVDHSQQGGYEDIYYSTNRDISDGDAPNMVLCYPDHVVKYNELNAVTPLDLYINNVTVGYSEEQKADFIAALYNNGAQLGDGQMYTLPLLKYADVLYYDKSFFEEHGLTVPTTWDEMEEVCKQILEIDPDAYPLGIGSESNWFITMCAQLNSPYTSATGEHYLFDNQTNRDFVKRFVGWYKNGYVMTNTLYGGYTSSLLNTASKDWQEKLRRAYMCIGPSQSSNYYLPDKVDGAYPFEVGVVSIPQIDPSDPKVITSNTGSFCMLNSDDAREMAATWLFIKFLTTNAEFQAEFSIETRNMPVIKSAAETSVFQAYLDSADGYDNISALATKVCLEQSDSYFSTPALAGESYLRTEIEYMIEASTFNIRDTDLDSYIKKIFEDTIARCKANS